MNDEYCKSNYIGIRKGILLIFLIITRKHFNQLFAQVDTLDNETNDSLWIVEVEENFEPDKVFHAEPLNIDLNRD